MRSWLVLLVAVPAICVIVATGTGVTLAGWRDDEPLTGATARAGTMHKPVLACQTSDGVVGVVLTTANLSWSVPAGGVAARSYVILKNAVAVARVSGGTLSWLVPDGEDGTYTVMSSLGEPTAPPAAAAWSSPVSDPVQVAETQVAELGLGEYCTGVP